ncbi:MAG: hypothetical protein H6Q90_2938 [Deltaproteobacteria bacterium]|nr:hypothetical protein [Deltaproteobacteria bacterium]
MRYIEIIAVLSLAMLGATPVAQADDRGRYAPPFTPAWAAPQLGVDPPGGPAGTRVRITGANFHRTVRVFFGDQPMPILERGRGYIVAMIPWHVRRDDFIYVVDSTGRARTVAPFDVIRPRRWGFEPRYREPGYRP